MSFACAGHRPVLDKATGRRATTCAMLSLAAILSLAGCGEEAQQAAGPRSPGPRNLILIVIDTLRADYLGCYGGTVATPFLDALAESGVRFERAYSHIPVTGPSHASLFTSGLPSDHGCVVNSQSLDEQNLTLAEILSGQGYSTAAIVSLGVLRSRFGFSQGFDMYSDHLPGRWWKDAAEINAVLSQLLPRISGDRPTFLFLHYSDPHTPYAPPDEIYPNIVLRRAGEIIAEQPANSRPTRITATLQPGANDFHIEIPPGEDRESLGCGRVQVHDKRISTAFPDGDGFLVSENGWPPTEDLPSSLRILNPTNETLTVEISVTFRLNLGPDDWPNWYAKEVAWMDGQIEQAVSMLTEAGLWEDSLVVLTSDHGEGLGQHGNMQHVEQLYESLLRVPLVIIAPGQLTAGQVVTTAVRHVDVLPTLLDLLDIPAPTEFRGTSLLPLIEHPESDRRPPVVSETHKPEAYFNQRAVVYERFKYIVNDSTGAEELYDLESDPDESSNLAGERPAMVAKLRAAMAAEYLRSYGPGVTQVGWDELSEEERAQLEALGYTR